jgi:hypothetical protein
MRPPEPGGGACGGAVKARTMRKVRKAPVARVTTAKLRKQLDDRTLERDEALEQLAVLKVISGSHGELESVFQSICARVLSDPEFVYLEAQSHVPVPRASRAVRQKPDRAR